MLQPIESFKVKVVNPTRKVKDGGLKKGELLTVRAIESEQLLNGTYHIYFMVWNEAVKNFMLEEAVQFKPMVQ